VGEQAVQAHETIVATADSSLPLVDATRTGALSGYARAAGSVS